MKRKRENRATSKDRRIRERCRAVQGDVSTFVGPAYRRALDKISDDETVSIAQLTRLGLYLLITHYQTHGVLPVISDEAQVKMRAGRKRRYTEVDSKCGHVSVREEACAPSRLSCI